MLGLIRSHGFKPAMWLARARLGRMIKISKITSRARLSASGGGRRARVWIVSPPFLQRYISGYFQIMVAQPSLVQR